MLYEAIVLRCQSIPGLFLRDVILKVDFIHFLIYLASWNFKTDVINLLKSDVF